MYTSIAECRPTFVTCQSVFFVVNSQACPLWCGTTRLGSEFRLYGIQNFGRLGLVFRKPFPTCCSVFHACVRPTDDAALFRCSVLCNIRRSVPLPRSSGSSSYLSSVGWTITMRLGDISAGSRSTWPDHSSRFSTPHYIQLVCELMINCSELTFVSHR